MVTLEQMLAARDARQERIHASLPYAPLVSFTMNIPGPVKDSPLIRRGFREGCRRLEEAFAGKFTLLDSVEGDTGCEALYAVRDDAIAIKTVCCAIEDRDEPGRLFDMDVIGADGRKLDRTELGLAERGCMICAAPGRGCAARRLHTVEELQAETVRRLKHGDALAVARIATECLLTEVRTTPKPGLVDRANNGSHTDMDLPLFEKSAAALAPYWAECVRIGMKTAELAPEDTFAGLRKAGLEAEQAMLSATAGVNTHKGAIFLLGTLCGAVGRLWSEECPVAASEELCRECTRMTGEPLRAELERLDESCADTAGTRLFLRRGIRGARGEIMDGLPGVREVALPALKNALDRGCEEEYAAAVALLHLIARGTDTNMVKRGGIENAAWGAEQAGSLVADGRLPAVEDIRALDRRFIEKNLSPGGCADLLAVTLFLRRLERGN